MTEHGTGVAQTEVDVAVAVSIHELDADGLLNEKGKGCLPVDHPEHGYAIKQMEPGLFGKLP